MNRTWMLIDNLTKENNALRQRVAELEKDNAALRGDLDIAESQASKRAHANAALREQVAVARKALEQIVHGMLKDWAMVEVAKKALADTAAAGEGK